MHLSINGHLLKIGQLGPEFVIIENPIDHPPGEAEILMSVDGADSRWRVRLTNGIAAGEPRAGISELAGA